MFDTVYQKLSLEIDAWITAEKHTGKLPGAIRLGRQFGANPATVIKALRLLAERGRVSINPSQGTFVLEEKVPQKVIGILGGLAGGASNERLLDQFNALTMPHGFQVTLMDGIHQLIHTRPSMLRELPCDAYAVFGINADILAMLRECGKPVVSLNACPNIPGVSYADFDWEPGFEQLIANFHAAGYRRFGFTMFANHQFNFCERMKALYEKTMRDFSLNADHFHAPYDAYKFYRRYGEEYHEIFARETMHYFLQLKPRIEVLYCHTSSFELKALRRYADAHGILLTGPQPYADPNELYLYYDNADMVRGALNILLDEIRAGKPLLRTYLSRVKPVCSIPGKQNMTERNVS